MVFFSCVGCGESVKKAQVEKHRWKCRQSTVMSCIDCHKDFHGEEYQSHLKCISEDQKYGGSKYIAKENKGEVKQEKWIQQVQKAIDSIDMKDTGLRSLLEQIRNFPNIPRKQQKFESFLKNSLRIRDLRLVSRAWTTITAANEQMNGQEKNGQENGTQSESMKRKMEEEETNDGEKNNSGPITKKIRPEETVHVDDDNQAACEESKFSWRKAIRSYLKSAPNNQVKLKKLRKAILSQYKNGAQDDNLGIDEAMTDSFERALNRLTGKQALIVEGKYVRSVTQ